MLLENKKEVVSILEMLRFFWKMENRWERVDRSRLNIFIRNNGKEMSWFRKILDFE